MTDKRCPNRELCRLQMDFGQKFTPAFTTYVGRRWNQMNADTEANKLAFIDDLRERLTPMVN